MAAAGIVLWCIAAATGYGIVHDLVTIRVCPEYFTIGHPPIGFRDSLTALAIAWGVFATWWVGLLLGLMLALAARLGRAPKRGVRSVVKPVLVVLGVSAISSLLSGSVGWLLASRGAVQLIGPTASAVPADRHVAFLADLWAHSASYGAGLLGGIVIAVRLWRSRQAEAAARLTAPR